VLSNSALVCLPDVASSRPTAKWASRHIRFLNGDEVHLSVQGPLSLPYRAPARLRAGHGEHQEAGLVTDLWGSTASVGSSPWPAGGSRVCCRRSSTCWSSVSLVWSPHEAAVRPRWGRGEAAVRPRWGRGEAANDIELVGLRQKLQC